MVHTIIVVLNTGDIMKVFVSSHCPNCNALKIFLSEKKKLFEEVDATTTKVVAFLRARKLPMQLPIIEEDGKFFTYNQYIELFK